VVKLLKLILRNILNPRIGMERNFLICKKLNLNLISIVSQSYSISNSARKRKENPKLNFLLLLSIMHLFLAQAKTLNLFGMDIP